MELSNPCTIADIVKATGLLHDTIYRRLARAGIQPVKRIGTVGLYRRQDIARAMTELGQPGRPRKMKQ